MSEIQVPPQTSQTQAKVSNIPDKRAQLLVVLLKSILSRPGGPTLQELKARAEVSLSAATISRIANGKPSYLRGNPAKLNADHLRLLHYLEVDQESFRTKENVPSPPIIFLNKIYNSEFHNALRVELSISPQRQHMMAEDFPGLYVGLCFSSSWPEGLCLYVSRIMSDSKNGGALTYKEVQINRFTGNIEKYAGTAFGKSENRGIVAAEVTQGFLRVMTQTMRSPHHGSLKWMRGVCISSVSNGSYVSPFYLERITLDGSFAPAIDEATALLVDDVVCIGDRIYVERRIRELCSRLSRSELKWKVFLSEWLANFLYSSLSHLRQLQSGIADSFHRLDGDVPRPAAELGLANFEPELSGNK